MYCIILYFLFAECMKIFELAGAFVSNVGRLFISESFLLSFSFSIFRFLHLAVSVSIFCRSIKNWCFSISYFLSLKQIIVHYDQNFTKYTKNILRNVICNTIVRTSSRKRCIVIFIWFLRNISTFNNVSRVSLKDVKIGTSVGTNGSVNGMVITPTLRQCGHSFSTTYIYCKVENYVFFAKKSSIIIYLLANNSNKLHDHTV